jgi:hypothetical protein
MQHSEVFFQCSLDGHATALNSRPFLATNTEYAGHGVLLRLNAGSATFRQNLQRNGNILSILLVHTPE